MLVLGLVLVQALVLAMDLVPQAPHPSSSVWRYLLCCHVCVFVILWVSHAVWCCYCVVSEQLQAYMNDLDRKLQVKYGTPQRHARRATTTTTTTTTRASEAAHAEQHSYLATTQSLGV